MDRAVLVLVDPLASVEDPSKAVRLVGPLAWAEDPSKAVRLVGRLSSVVAAGDPGEVLCDRKVGLVAVLDRGRRERLERHACLEVAFDHSPARLQAVFAVVEVHVDRILEEGTGRAHNPDRGTSVVTDRASLLAPTDCLDSLAPFLACFVLNGLLIYLVSVV